MSGPESGFEWLSQVLEGTASDDALRAECASMLSDVFEVTYRQLTERQSEFAPLLPDDDESTMVRAQALAHWSEGFLHGLVSAGDDQRVRKRLAAEPLAEIVKDLLEMTRAAAGEAEDAESDETAYAELVEYLRVSAQVAYEELATIRHSDRDAAGDKKAVH